MGRARGPLGEHRSFVWETLASMQNRSVNIGHSCHSRVLAPPRDRGHAQRACTYVVGNSHPSHATCHRCPPRLHTDHHVGNGIGMADWRATPRTAEARGRLRSGCWVLTHPLNQPAPPPRHTPDRRRTLGAHTASPCCYHECWHTPIHRATTSRTDARGVLLKSTQIVAIATLFLCRRPEARVYLVGASLPARAPRPHAVAQSLANVTHLRSRAHGGGGAAPRLRSPFELGESRQPSGVAHAYGRALLHPWRLVLALRQRRHWLCYFGW